MSPLPGILTPPVRTGQAGHWAASLSYKAECAWAAVRGIEQRIVHRDDAPCPRCGMELRAGSEGAKAHDRTALVPFFERNGLEVRAGFQCRLPE